MLGYGVPRLAICPLPDASRVPIGRCNDDEISVRIANPKFAVIGVRISMYVKHDDRLTARRHERHSKVGVPSAAPLTTSFDLLLIMLPSRDVVATGHWVAVGPIGRC
jgi:hypothetical protein